MTSLCISNTGAVQTCDTMWCVWWVAGSSVALVPGYGGGGGGGSGHCYPLLIPSTAGRQVALEERPDMTITLVS